MRLQLADPGDHPLLGTLPIIPAIRVGGDSGRPAAAVRDTPQAAAFERLTAVVLEAVSQPSGHPNTSGPPSDWS